MAEISLSVDKPVSNEGYFVISWQADSSEPRFLQQASSKNFQEGFTLSIPLGSVPTGSVTLTGLSDGKYYYRIIKAEPDNLQIPADVSAFSPSPLMVTVQHHSLERAATFFALGAVLLVILIGTLITGRSVKR